MSQVHEPVLPEDCSWLECAEPLTALSPAGYDSADAASSSPGEDVVGGLAPLRVRLIKTAVSIILKHIIEEELCECCFGCEVDHPSQMKHSCE